MEKAAALRIEQDTATVTAGYRSTLEKLKAKYEAQLHEARSLAAATPELAMPPASLHASLNSSVSSHALDAEDMPAPLPLDLSTHEWLNVRSNFHHLRLRPQGVAKQWRVHDIKMFDAEGTNTCTDPNRMKVSGGSQGHGSDTCKVTGYWEAPLGSKDNCWIRYDLPALKVVWRVETRSSAEDGLQPLRLVLEGSRDGKEWVSVSWASGTVVKPQKVYHVCAGTHATTAPSSSHHINHQKHLHRTAPSFSFTKRRCVTRSHSDLALTLRKTKQLNCYPNTEVCKNACISSQHPPPPPPSHIVPFLACVSIHHPH